MTEKERADFNNYPIVGDVKNFIELLSSIAARANSVQGDTDASNR